MIGIGIIGAGRICAAHAASVLALPETRLAAIAETDETRLAQAVEKYGGKGYADYREMLQDPDVEAVIIGLPHWLHRDAAIESLNAGKHVLLEKPMAMTVAECDAMIEAARASGKTLMVAHSQHYFPVNVAARKFLREGGIGSIVMAADTWYKPFYDGQRPAWFLDDARGGGMWSMNGSHMIDRLTFLLDDRVAAVKARVGNPIFGLSTDMGAAMLEFASGVYATIMHAGYKDGVNRFEAEFTGAEGQLRISGDRGGGSGFFKSRQGKWEEVPVPDLQLELRPGAEIRNAVFAAEIQDFARCVIEDREPSISGEYGRRIVRVLTACEESSRTGREVRLDG